MSIDPASNAATDAQGKQLSIVNPLPVLRPPGLVDRALERVISRKSKFFGLLWLLAIVGVGLLVGNIQGSATQFHGLATSQQQAISFQYPVEVVEVPVVEGQPVAAGARLLQVRRYDLDVELAVIDENIGEIRARRAASRRASSAEIGNLRAERRLQLEQINTRVQSLQTRYRLNQALVKSISSEPEAGAVAPESPLGVRIGGLQAEHKQLAAYYQAKIGSIEKELAQDLEPARAQIAELEEQKQELQRQAEALVVSAPFAGRVGGIMFKPGEQVDAFSPILSIHGASTRHIKGYIHEAVFNDVRVGQIVWIKAPSATSDNELISGIVESLGSRIVEYPERLKRSPLVSAWGREAIIRLQQQNKLLLGEKVVVLLQRPEPILDHLLACLEAYLPIAQVRAWAGYDAASDAQSPRFIDLRIDGLEPAQLEASGISWNPATMSYLLVSDEQPALFEMSPVGDIDKRHELDSFAGIDDLESVSQDGGYVYLAASLSHNSKNQLKPKRRQLMRLRLGEGGIESADTLDLYQLLQDLRDDVQTDAGVGVFLGVALDDGSLDIEAHAVVDNTLFLGFKAPLDADGNAVILRLENVAGLFAGEAARAAIWQRLNLRHGFSSADSRLSDFSFSDDALYLLSVSQQDDRLSSYLWRFDLTSRALSRVREFPGLRAEGLSVNATGLDAMIVFDGDGELPSQFLRLRI